MADSLGAPWFVHGALRGACMHGMCACRDDGIWGITHVHAKHAEALGGHRAGAPAMRPSINHDRQSLGVLALAAAQGRRDLRASVAVLESAGFLSSSPFHGAGLGTLGGGKWG